MNRVLVAAVVALLPVLAAAGTLDIQPVTDGVWAIVGEKEQRSATNLANNATFGLLETEQGAVLIDPGGSWKGAEALHEAIRTVTDQPVLYVVNTGGQDHRWLGNGYWQAQGAIVIASEAAVEDQQARGSMQMTMLSQLIGDALDGTEPSYADVTFADRHTLDLGDLTLESNASSALATRARLRNGLESSRQPVRLMSCLGTAAQRRWSGRVPIPTIIW